MRIGIDITGVNDKPTGIGNYSLTLIKCLLFKDKKNKYMLFNFSSSKKQNVFDTLNFKQVFVKNIYSFLPLSILRRIWNILPFISADFIYKKIDLLYLSDNFYLPIKNIPLIGTIYDMTIYLFPKYHYKRNISFHKKRNALLAKKAKLIITVSENSKKDISQILKIPMEKIKVIYGVANNIYKPIKNKYLINKTLDKYQLLYKKYFLFVGTLEPRKNVEILLKAFKLIQNKIDSRYKIVLIGKKAWGWNAIQKEIKRLDLKDRVVVTDYIPIYELPIIMNGAKIFVYPSFYEGFGLPVIEAMSCGIPVIVSNTSSFPEIVDNCGIMIDPKDNLALSKAMLSLIHDKQMYKKLSEKAYYRSKEFSRNKLVNSIIKVYEDIK